VVDAKVFEVLAEEINVSRVAARQFLMIVGTLAFYDFALVPILESNLIQKLISLLRINLLRRVRSLICEHSPYNPTGPSSLL
jgi:hypothetical protein